MALIISAIWGLEQTGLDLAWQSQWYDPASAQWWWDRNEPWTRFLFYDGIKQALIAFAAGLAVVLLVQPRRVSSYRRRLMTVCLALIVVPSVIGVLKATTDVPCPRQLLTFGGELPYTTIRDWRPAVLTSARRSRCFPAGHASGGFALMSLYYLFQSRAARVIGMLSGLALGWTMGMYKTVIGDHFVSHTIVTMCLAWVLIVCLARLTGAERPLDVRLDQGRQ